MLTRRVGGLLSVQCRDRVEEEETMFPSNSKGISSHLLTVSRASMTYHECSRTFQSPDDPGPSPGRSPGMLRLRLARPGSAFLGPTSLRFGRPGAQSGPVIPNRFGTTGGRSWYGMVWNCIGRTCIQIGGPRRQRPPGRKRRRPVYPLVEGLPDKNTHGFHSTVQNRSFFSSPSADVKPESLQTHSEGHATQTD